MAFVERVYAPIVAAMDIKYQPPLESGASQ
jgi:hypothetical protein